MTEEVKFKSEFLDIVKDLSSINNEILIEKNDDEVFIIRQDAGASIRYMLNAPLDYFNFPNETVAIYNYAEFYKFYKCIQDPKIFMSEDMMSITDDSATIDYKLSDPNTLSKNGKCKPIKFPNPDIIFKLSKQDLDTITKMVTSFSAKHAKIYGDEHEFYIKIIANDNQNSFIKKFDFENNSDFDGEFNFVIFADTFRSIPQKKNYEVSIVNKGYVKFHVENENDIDLDLITTYVTGK